MNTIYKVICAVLILATACTPKVTDPAMSDAKSTAETAASDAMDKVSKAGIKESFRSTAPKAGAAPVINIGEAESFMLDNGLKVIVVENHKVPRVSFQLRLINDPILEGDKVGKVSMTGDILRRGTTNMTKAELDAAIDFLGASISSSGNGIFASSLTKHRDKVLGYMSDVLFNPSFPTEELEKIKKQTLSGLETVKTDPNSIANNVRSRVSYGKDHPYGEVQTSAHVEAITIDDLKQVYNTYYVPSNAYLVVVGDITPDVAKKVARKNFGDWSGSMIKPTRRSKVQMPSSTNVSFANKEGAVQSVISVSNPVEIKPGDADAIPASVMNAILGGGFSSRLMQNLREDKAYTYGARSSIRPDIMTGIFNAGASTRTEVTDSSVTEIIYELNRMRTEPVPAEELQSIKNYMTGGFARSLESPQTIARFAYNIAKYNLPSDYYQTYLQKLNDVTSEDVLAMANKYLQPEHMNIVIVGNKDDVAENLKKFDADGKLTFYDAFGEVMEVNDSPLSSDITAEQIIDDYVAAVGGADVIGKVKTMYTKMKGSIMGQELISEVYQKDDSMFKMVQSAGGMTLSNQIYDGEVVTISAMGQNQEVTEGPQFEILKAQSVIVPQKNYQKQGLKMELKGIEMIDGANAYKVNIYMTPDQKITEYYDVTSGLLKRMVTTAEGPAGPMTTTIDYGDYKAVEGGLMVPFSYKISAPTIPGGSLPMAIQKATPNQAMSNDIFSAN